MVATTTFGVIEDANGPEGRWYIDSICESGITMQRYRMDFNLPIDVESQLQALSGMCQPGFRAQQRSRAG